jgi:hypothetical protein
MIDGIVKIIECMLGRISESPDRHLGDISPKPDPDIIANT